MLISLVWTSLWLCLHRTFKPGLRLTFCTVASECHDPSLYNDKEPLEIAECCRRSRDYESTWSSWHIVIQVKVIFVVMKQLKQLQRKPRNKINGILSTTEVWIFVGRRSRVSSILYPLFETEVIYNYKSLQLLLKVTSVLMSHNCEDHVHLYSLSAVHTCDLYHINIVAK